MTMPLGGSWRSESLNAPGSTAQECSDSAGLTSVFPFRADGSETRWAAPTPRLPKQLLEQGYLRVVHGARGPQPYEISAPDLGVGSPT